MDTPAPSAGPTPPNEHTAPPEHTEGTLIRNTSESHSSSLDDTAIPSLDTPLHETPKHGLPLDEPTAVGRIEPSDAEIKAEAAVAYASPHRWLRFGLIGVTLVACAGLTVFASRQPAAQDPVSSIDHLYGHVTVPYDQLPSPKLDAAATLPNIATVNGELDIQGSLVLAPTAQPAAPIPGQLYFDQTSSELSYFNGKSFNTVLTTDTLPPQQTGLSAGGGLSLANGLLTNAGVLSLQGKSGNVTLSTGPGLQVAGTTFSNTGVLSIGGLSGAVVLGNGLSASNGTLASTGIQSLSTDGSLNIIDDGNGNYTITGPMGVGSGNVSTVGGTAGHLAVFNNAQAISDSIISQSGTTVSVAGNLVVTGTISAVSYSGDGASITNVNASNLSSGTLSDSRLSINVPLLNANDNFTGSLQHNGNAICDTSGNCVGVSGGSIGGSGTANKLALFTGSGFTVGNSLLSQDAGATTVTIAGNVSITGSLSASSLSGNGSGVTNVNAAQLGGQASSYYVNASNLSTGTLNDARLSTNVALKNSAANFTSSLQHNGNNVCDVSGNCVGVSGGGVGGSGTANLIALFTGSGFTVGNSILSQDVGATTVTVAGNVVATSFSGNGANLTSLNGSNVSSGTVGDARLSGNVALKNTSSNFTSSLQHNGNDVCDTSGNCVGSGSAGSAVGGSGTANKIALFTGSGFTVGNSILSQDVGATTLTIGGNTTTTGSITAGSFTGNGASLTNVNAAQLNGQAASYYLNASNLSAGLLSTARGGTGLDSSLASNGQLLIGNGSGFTLGTLTSGTGINVSNAAGSITISSSGATGTAGGDLSGSYPNPTVAKIRGTNVSFVSLVSGDVLQYNGTNIVNSHITNSNLSSGTYGAITGTGALTAGSIASGFGTISTANTITTSSTLQGVTINATTGYQAAGTSGASVTCSGGQFLQDQVVSGGIVTGGTCATTQIVTVGALDGGTANANGATLSGTTLYLQSASASFAGLVTTGAQTFAGDKTFTGNLHISNVLLADASDLTFTAADTATDPNVIFNMQCRTGCSSTQGRFAIQSNGTDAFSIGYNTTTTSTIINVAAGVDIKLAGGSVGNFESAITHDFTCSSTEQPNDIVVITGAGVVARTTTANSTAVAGVVVAKPSSTTCSIATSGEAQVWLSTNTANVGNSVSTSAIGGAAQSQSIPSGGQSIGHFMSTKNGSNLAWVLLNGS